MSFFDYFRSEKQPSSASVAKERLKIIVAHERGQRSVPDYLPQMQQEIIEVIRKYIPIEKDQVNIQLDSNENCSVLEVNVTLPD
ncbi:MAG: cell division topological specificity factor MinE [Pontibacterium sp.]